VEEVRRTLSGLAHLGYIRRMAGDRWRAAVIFGEHELATVIAELMPWQRALLAKGPMLPGEDQEDCRVCEAMPASLGDPTPAEYVLLRWHALEGVEGDRCYARCVAIYRAAGWTGEYDARDLHGFVGNEMGC
jgi:hypothetical protein